MSDPANLPADVRHKLLLARTAHIAGAYDEAHHWLYAIACPGFDCYDPWAALEGRQCSCGPHRMESAHVPTVAELEAIVAPSATDQPTVVLHDNKANVSVRCPDCDDGAYKGTDRICLTCNGLGELRRATFPTPAAQPIAVTGNCGLCGQPRADHAEVAPDGKPECRMKENSHHG